MTPEIVLTGSPDELARRAADVLADAVREAVERKGSCALGLSGGKTPRAAYALLGETEGIDWTRVTVFLVDERLVPDTDGRSNARLLEETLLAAAADHATLLLPDTSLAPDACAADYDARLKAAMPEGPDVITLGLGEDGHIASLFPPLGPDAAGDAFAIHTTTQRFEVFDRVGATLTFLEKAGRAVFLLQGESKKRTWEEMEAGGEGWERWPAKRILARCETSVIAQW